MPEKPGASMEMDVEPRPSGLLEGDVAFRSLFSVGAVSVAVMGNCRDVTLGPSLQAFRVERVTPSINVRVEWVDSLGPTPGCQVFDSGTTWRLTEDQAIFQFDISAPMFGDRPYKKLLVDQRFRHATLQMSEASFASFPCVAQPLEYPLDELLIMHRLTQEKAIELHGSGIVPADGMGNLFVGHSGAGKSTTTRLWTGCEGVEVLSDDRIIVRRDQESSVVEMPCQGASAGELHEVLRLRDRSAAPTGRSAQDDKKNRLRMYGTPWHGEAMYASPGSAPLARIFILEHGYGNVLTPLSSSQAVAELFARSFVPFHRHQYVESALEFLQEVVDAVPVYRYQFEPDQRAVDTVLNFHD
jgi:hypothetical protein